MYLEQLPLRKIHFNKELKSGLNSLCENKNLVIRPADKGGGIIVLDKKDYLAEMSKILGDRDTYTPLRSDPKAQYKRELEAIVQYGFDQGILNSKEKPYLVPKAPRTPVIYYLPKIHKHPTCPPGRPIVSGIDSISSRVGRYIDFFLQPLVSKMPSHLKDSRHVINLLSNITPKSGCWLVTADVASLYTVIPHSLGLFAVEYYLRRDSALFDEQICFIMQLLHFVATRNYFWFGGQFYRQDRGVAMGAKYAPSLANLFMALWEEDVIYAHQRPQVVLWARYIDDVLLLWDGDRHDLDAFMSMLNDNNRGIRFAYEASQTEINFLDLKISIRDGQLSTATYFKNTDRNSYIPTDSCHHEAWLRSVPKSQLIRLKRNCSDHEEFLAQADVLIGRFLEKGYSEVSLKTTLDEVATLDRRTLLNHKVPNMDRAPSVPFITTYSLQHRNVARLVKKYWHVLQNDHVLGTILPAKPQMVYKGAPSLRGRVAPNILDPPPIKRGFFEYMTGFYQCRKCRICSLSGCMHRRTHKFISTSTSVEFEIKSFITCSTERVVYLLQCPCGLQYVGRTKRPLSVRLNEHVTNILAGFPKHPVSRHYLETHNRDPRKTIFLGIDRYTIPWRGGSLLRGISRLEMAWIYKLRCYTPFGLNVEVDLNAFLDNS